MNTFLPKICLMMMDYYNKREAKKRMEIMEMLRDDMTCPTCGSELDDGHTEDLGEGYTETYHSCHGCGAQVFTS